MLQHFQPNLIWEKDVLIRSDYRFSRCVTLHDSISNRDSDSLSGNKSSPPANEVCEKEVMFLQ